MLKSSKLVLIFLLSLQLFGCKLESDESWQYDAMGEIGDVAVLTDQMSWAKHGSLIDSIFGKSLPGVAGTEPFFNIRRTDESKFDGYFKKNYNLFVFIQEERWSQLKPLFSSSLQQKISEKFNSEGIVVFKAEDVWAKPQEVHFVLMPNDKSMEETLRTKRSSFLIQAMEAESKTTITTLISGSAQSDSFMSRMKNEKGYGFRKPSTYDVSVRSDDCMGITRFMNTKKLSMYWYEEPYTNDSQFTTGYIVQRRDEVLKQHIHGTDRPDSIPTFMSTDTLNVKIFSRQLDINGLYAIETRGWWEMKNDYMAGPFVNYTILCKKTNKVVTLDGNVFAPGHAKHELIRQLELIAGTFEESK